MIEVASANRRLIRACCDSSETIEKANLGCLSHLQPTTPTSSWHPPSPLHTISSSSRQIQNWLPSVLACVLKLASYSSTALF